jgi:hypothetical protein
MKREDFCAAVRASAPDVKIFETDAYILNEPWAYSHLCEPVVMEVSDDGCTWKKRIVVGFRGCVVTTNAIYKLCRPIKTKRLMTPAECAGKWTCKDGERVLVCGYFNGDRITTTLAISTVKELHERGWMIADTPTSEPYSMEINS